MRDGNRTDKLYDADAQFYDALHEDFIEDLELIKRLAKDTEGPLLELMSGTGRVLFPLARAGHEVWGLDANDAMLAKAKAKLALEPKETGALVHLQRGDARGFSLGRKFPFIFLTFNSFLHLITFEDQEACLRAVRDHLTPDGRFLIAFFNPDLKRLEQVVKLRKIAQVGPEEQLVWLESQTFDLPKQTTDIYYIYDLLGEGGDVRRRMGRFTLRLVFADEFKHTLQRCGLEVIQMMGGYDGREFQTDSPFQIYLCRRGGVKD